MPFLVRWLVHAIVLVVVAAIFPKIYVSGLGMALVAALGISLLNTFLGPVLHILAIPITIMTLGFFALVINGFLFWLAGEMLPGFSVHGPFTAIFGALAYTLLSHGILRMMTRALTPAGSR